MEGGGYAVVECTREAGRSRTLAPRHPAVRHVAVACTVSPSPPVTAPQKATALPHILNQMKP